MDVTTNNPGSSMSRSVEPSSPAEVSAPTIADDTTIFIPPTPAPADDDLFLPPPGLPNPRCRLAHVLAAVIRIFMTVIPARVSTADTFRSHFRHASSPLRVTQLAAMLPIPIFIKEIDNEYCRVAFMAALDPPKSPFDRTLGASAPPLRRWLARLLKEAHVSPCVYLAVLVYVDRLLASSPAFALTSNNVHRVVAACFVLACKEFEDRPMWMAGFSALTGIPADELKGLEVAMLRLLNYRMHITVEDFAKAEAAFIAEAMEAGDGHELILHLGRLGVNAGLDNAMAHVKSWTRMVPSTLPDGSMRGHPSASSTDPMFYPTYTFEGNRVWRPVVRREDVRAWEVRVCALAQALAEHQFVGIPLQPRPVWQGPSDWQLMGIFGATGFERLQMLRDIVLNHELWKADEMLPPLCMRASQYWKAQQDVQQKPRVGLGPTGEFLVKEHWNFALVPEWGENPWRELVMYGDEDITIPEGKARSRVYGTPPPSPIDLKLDDEPIDYPPGFVPTSPAPTSELWNTWWREQRHLQLERDSSSQVGEPVAGDGVCNRSASRLPVPVQAPPVPASDALPSRSVPTNNTRHGCSDASVPERLPPTPAAPPGFTPPPRSPVRIPVHALLNKEEKEVCRPPASARRISVGNYFELDDGGRRCEDTSVFSRFAAVTGHGIWADAPNSKIVPSPQPNGHYPHDESLALWHAQDVSAAVALNALQGEETLETYRGEDPLSRSVDGHEGPVADSWPGHATVASVVGGSSAPSVEHQPVHGLFTTFSDRTVDEGENGRVPVQSTKRHPTVVEAAGFCRYGTMDEPAGGQPASVEHRQVNGVIADQFSAIPIEGVGHGAAIYSRKQHPRTLAGPVFGPRMRWEEALGRGLAAVDGSHVDGTNASQLRRSLAELGDGNAAVCSGHPSATSGSIHGLDIPVRESQVCEGVSDSLNGLPSARVDIGTAVCERVRDHLTVVNSVFSPRDVSIDKILGGHGQVEELIAAQQNDLPSAQDGSFSGCHRPQPHGPLAESELKPWRVSVKEALPEAPVPSPHRQAIAGRLKGLNVGEAGGGSVVCSAHKRHVPVEGSVFSQRNASGNKSSLRSCSCMADKNPHIHEVFASNFQESPSAAVNFRLRSNASAAESVQGPHDGSLDESFMQCLDPSQRRQITDSFADQLNKILGAGESGDAIVRAMQCRNGRHNGPGFIQEHAVEEGTYSAVEKLARSNSVLEYRARSSALEEPLRPGGIPLRRSCLTSAGPLNRETSRLIDLDVVRKGPIGVLSRRRAFIETEAPGLGMFDPEIWRCNDAGIRSTRQTRIAGECRSAIPQDILHHGWQAAEQSTYAADTQGHAKQADGESDDSPTIVLGMWFKAAKSEPRMYITTASV